MSDAPEGREVPPMVASPAPGTRKREQPITSCTATGDVASISRPVRVVLCDDAVAYRKVMRMFLHADPTFQLVGEATNGREAIDMVADLIPDLLLLDISMPIMTGLEALPGVREASPGTTVLMLTGLTSDAICQEAERLGAVAVVDKADGLAGVHAALRSLAYTWQGAEPLRGN